MILYLKSKTEAHIMYDVKTIKHGDLECTGRPCEWNAEVADISECTDENGKKCYATKYVASCCKCAGLIEFTNDHVSVKCNECKFGVEMVIDDDVSIFPFKNPGDINLPC